MIRESALKLIQQQGKGLSYAAILESLGVERPQLDAALLGLVAAQEIRHTAKGYVPMSHEGRVLGQAKPLRILGNSRTCKSCKLQKPPAEFYVGLSECKACFSDRVQSNRRARRKGIIEKLVTALTGIAACPCGCAQIAAKALEEVE